jgi:transposase
VPLPGHELVRLLRNRGREPFTSATSSDDGRLPAAASGWGLASRCLRGNPKRGGTGASSGSRTHTSLRSTVFEFVASTEGRLQLFFLPSYSPQLNPDEWVWKNVKHDRIARKVPQSREELKAIAYSALRRLQQLPGTVQGFFRDPHLAYISEGTPATSCGVQKPPVGLVYGPG